MYWPTRSTRFDAHYAPDQRWLFPGYFRHYPMTPRQLNRLFHEAADAAGVSVTRCLAEGYNHFEILETLASPYGLLGRLMLERMAAR